MSELTILTFAEIEFGLRVRSEQAGIVRTQLGISDDASADIVVAAGISSLLARGLCTTAGGAGTQAPLDVEPGELMLGVIAALSTSHTRTEVVTWVGERPALMHLFTAPAVRLAVWPAAYGQFTVEILDPAEPLADVVMRFMDVSHPEDGDAAVIVRSTAGASDVRIAIAREAGGGWNISDTRDDPESSRPVTRDEIRERLVVLLGAEPATV